MNKEERQLLQDKYAGEASGAFEEDRKRLLAGEPLAFVIGWLPFLGLKVHLDSRPLIPRPETEWWTEELLAVIRKVWPRGIASERKSEDLPKDSQKLRLLDLCAGSGAIGLVILNTLPYVEVTFAELVPEHTEQIRKNIELNGLDADRARVVVSDVFNALGEEKFDVIATNPPYIPAGRELDESVTKWEPATALYSGADGLELIRRIAREARGHMNEGGQLWMECDSEHAEEAKALLAAGGAGRVELRTDQYGRNRLLVAYY